MSDDVKSVPLALPVFDQEMAEAALNALRSAAC